MGDTDQAIFNYFYQGSNKYELIIYVVPVPMKYNMYAKKQLNTQFTLQNQIIYNFYKYISQINEKTQEEYNNLRVNERNKEEYVRREKIINIEDI